MNEPEENGKGDKSNKKVKARMENKAVERRKKREMGGFNPEDRLGKKKIGTKCQ